MNRLSPLREIESMVQQWVAFRCEIIVDDATNWKTSNSGICWKFTYWLVCFKVIKRSRVSAGMRSSLDACLSTVPVFLCF